MRHACRCDIPSANRTHEVPSTQHAEHEHDATMHYACFHTSLPCISNSRAASATAAEHVATVCFNGVHGNMMSMRKGKEGCRGDKEPTCAVADCGSSAQEIEHHRSEKELLTDRRHDQHAAHVQPLLLVMHAALERTNKLPNNAAQPLPHRVRCFSRRLPLFGDRASGITIHQVPNSLHNWTKEKEAGAEGTPKAESGTVPDVVLSQKAAVLASTISWPKPANDECSHNDCCRERQDATTEVKWCQPVKSKLGVHRGAIEIK